MNFGLDDAIAEAKRRGSYFVTVTTYDKNKKEDELNHHHFRETFPMDDILPSVDRCLREVTPHKQPQPIPTVQPPRIYEKRKPLKIAIITHFNRCPDSFSPGKAVKNQIKILRKYGHEVVFFVMSGSKLDVGCEMRPVMPSFRRIKNVVDEEGKKKVIDVLREELTVDFDLAITHDFYIDDCITFREAIKECGVNIPWLHWARSGVSRQLDFRMDNARYVYMNHSESQHFANQLGIKHDRVRVVFNEKDPALMFNWHETTSMISNKMRLWEKDIIQIYPMCTTRMSAKGINSVIWVFSELKKLGKKVALIICNSNGRKRAGEIEAKMEYAKQLGLTEDDFLFTSTLADKVHPIESEVPHRVVSELFHIANLFVFPTLAEVCSNVLLEASMTKNLVVINEDVACLKDFVGDMATLSYPFTSLKTLHYTGRSDNHFQELGKKIIGQLDSNKLDKQFRHTWRAHCVDTIYHEMLEPILFEELNN